MSHVPRAMGPWAVSREVMGLETVADAVFFVPDVVRRASTAWEPRECGPRASAWVRGRTPAVPTPERRHACPNPSHSTSKP
jgi:hypothetical protein